MTATRWLYTIFILGLLFVVVGIFHSDALVLFGLAFMVTPLTLGAIAEIERNYRIAQVSRIKNGCRWAHTTMKKVSA